jgi:hypothetical protein
MMRGGGAFDPPGDDDEPDGDRPDAFEELAGGFRLLRVVIGIAIVAAGIWAGSCAPWREKDPQPIVPSPVPSASPTLR